MNLPTQQLLAIITIYFLTLAEPIQKDPLIDQRGEVIVKVCVILLAVGSVIAVKILSPRVEHAIIFAIVVSFGLIAFFLIR
jgi:presenilin-like A22 family membrane protease